MNFLDSFGVLFLGKYLVEGIGWLDDSRYFCKRMGY